LVRLIVLALGLALWPSLYLSAAELDDAEKLYRGGQYAECIAECGKAIAADQWQEGWRLLKIRAELATGKGSQALATFEAAAKRYPTSIRLRILGTEVMRTNDRGDEAAQLLHRIQELASGDPWRYSDATNRVVLGRALLLAGADARQVLELFFDMAKKNSPSAVDPYLASGDLALSKNDYALAVESFREAAKRVGDDPDIHFNLARAHANDTDEATKALVKALELNPNHVPSLLFQIDNAIDAEEYAEAEKLIVKVLGVNPTDSRAWSYRALLAHLANDEQRERECRTIALSTWSSNPEVDHLIGGKLSQKYRFAEGAAYQNHALCFDPQHRAAKLQLCQDLLRLGEEDEGWRLAAEVFDEDKYNVVAFNLSTLHDNLSKFQSLENEDFVVRMDEREAAIYGPRVMRLLERAKETLCAKYDVELNDPIIVELFHQQKDFAIRTFGLPGGAGFLGVCFGGVITANSPASQGATPSNWEAVLWHEFCHVVTLHKTRNKMPRWLSEGISVYEERQQNRAWGQSMTPKYREMVLDGEATAVSQLSGAFLKPKSSTHLRFAYYESSMVVEYLVERHGLDAIKRVLDDLGDGVPINDALSRHTDPIKTLDEEFAKWFRAKAEGLAEGVDLEQPDLPPDAGAEAIAAWNKDHPNNLWGLLAEGRALVEARKWDAAKPPLRYAVELYPDYHGEEGPYTLLAVIHRELDETDDERAVLEKLVSLDADAIAARLRLAELAEERKDWKAVADQASHALAINPLVPAPYRHLAKAAGELDDRSVAIEAYEALLRLEPLDLAETHFRLARLLRDEGRLPEARRHALESLEQAPRYRDAHRLLLEIVDRAESPKADDSAATDGGSIDSSTTHEEK
jgi:tetratricopeptide (TPR) repeat protein